MGVALPFSGMMDKSMLNRTAKQELYQYPPVLLQNREDYRTQSTMIQFENDANSLSALFFILPVDVLCFAIGLSDNRLVYFNMLLSDYGPRAVILDIRFDIVL